MTWRPCRVLTPCFDLIWCPYGVLAVSSLPRERSRFGVLGYKSFLRWLVRHQLALKASRVRENEGIVLRFYLGSTTPHGDIMADDTDMLMFKLYEVQFIYFMLLRTSSCIEFSHPSQLTILTFELQNNSETQTLQASLPTSFSLRQATQNLCHHAPRRRQASALRQQGCGPQRRNGAPCW